MEAPPLDTASAGLANNNARLRHFSLGLRRNVKYPAISFICLRKLSTGVKCENVVDIEMLLIKVRMVFQFNHVKEAFLVLSVSR